MRLIVLASVLAASAVLAAAPALADTSTTVTQVVDGDTIETSAGTVRLLQIDSPETGECHAKAAKKLLGRVLPKGTRIKLRLDPALDRKDRYGRILAHVWKGQSLVNLRLVKEGAAAPYFYRGDRGQHARSIEQKAKAARDAGRGLWGACRGGNVPYTPTQQVSTGPATKPPPTPPPSGSGSKCDSNYTGGCVPLVSYDLDCSDIDFSVVVVGSDPHGFDRDGDGRGCETNARRAPRASP